MNLTDERDNRQVQHQPALVVGLGGTGIAALRYIRLLARTYGGETDLASQLSSRGLSFLGIDTDPDTNAVRKFDAEILDADERRDLLEGRSIRTIDRLRGEELHIVEQKKIANVLEVIRRKMMGIERDAEGATESDDNGSVYEAICEWFPGRDERTLAEITLGHARGAGASQYRPLGRIAFFSEAAGIYKRLSQKFAEVRAVSDDRGLEPRIYIVASLAGGTGAGMFWDVAFLLRTINRDVPIVGCFLLGDTFENPDRAGRVRPNTYASLKELAAYKNWTQSDVFRVEYPIPPKILEFKAYNSEISCFDYVYLYSAARPAIVDAEFDRKTIDLSAFRISQNIVSQLRLDVQRAISVGANNEAGDVNALADKRDRTFVFSTSSTTQFGIRSAQSISTLMLTHVYDRLRQYIAGEHGSLGVLQLDEDRDGLGDARLSSAEESIKRFFESKLGEQPRVMEDLAAALERNLRDLADSHLLADELAFEAEEELNRQLEEMNLLRAGKTLNEATVLDRFVAEQRLQRFQEVFRACFEESGLSNLVAKWEEALKGKSPYEQVSRAARFATLVDIYAIELETAWRELEAISENYERRLDEELGVISDQACKWFTASSDDATGTAVSARDDRLAQPISDLLRVQEQQLVLNPGSSLVQAAPHLGLGHKPRAVDRGRWSVAHVMKANPSVRVGRAIVRLFLALIDDAKGKEFGRAARRSAIESFFNSKASAFRQRADNIVERAQRNRDLRQKQLKFFESQRLQKKELERTIHPRDQAVLRDLMDRLIIYLRQVFEEQGEDEIDRLARYFSLAMRHTDFGRSINIDDSGRPIFDEAVWHNALSELRQPSQAGREPAIETFDRFLATLCPRDVKIVDSAHELTVHMNLIDLVLEKILGYWLNRPAFIVERAGGEAGILKRLHSSKSTVFNEGHDLENLIKKDHLVVLRPDLESEQGTTIDRLAMEEVWPGGDDVRVSAELDNALHMAATNLTNGSPIAGEPSPMPIIYFQQLFRSGDVISRIGDYWYQYHTVEPGVRRFFHFDKRAVDLPELVDVADLRATTACGNDDCTYNIRHLPRSEIFCPDCHKPIWNRCGNPVCGADDLKARILGSGARGAFTKRPIRHDCPKCTEPLKTWWWHCRHQIHSMHPVPMDKTICPHCLEEHRQGIRTYDEMSFRADPRGKPCPGCWRLDPNPENAVRIPPRLLPYFHDGVNGHQTLQFQQALERSKFASVMCSNQSVRHELFPSHVVMVDGQESAHHVYRNKSGKFVCQAHSDARFYECHSCRYPIDQTDERLVNSGTTQCPRCFTGLEFCHFCSDKDGRLFSSLASDRPGYERCPRCHNFMAGGAKIPHSETKFELAEPAFCRNFFGCRAGADPRTHVTEDSVEICEVCPTDAAYLLPYDELDRHVGSCPVCSYLIGEANGAHEGKNQIADLVTNFSDGDKLASLEFHEPCAVCGFMRGAMIAWLWVGAHQNDQGEAGDKALAGNHQAPDVAGWEQLVSSTPKVPVESVLEVLEIIRDEHDDDAAFRTISKRYGEMIDGLPDGFSTLHAYLRNRYAPDHVSARALGRRLDAIATKYTELRNRRKDTRRKGGQPTIRR